MARQLSRFAGVGLSMVLAMPSAHAQPARYPFAEAVQQGDVLYLSGQIGIAPGQAGLVEGGVATETRQAMENIGAVLRRNGRDYADLVKCTVMMTDMAQWAKMNQVYAGFFPDGKFPARSALGATALALGASVEIDCIARAGIQVAGISPSKPLGPYSQAVRAGNTIYVSGVIPFDSATNRFAQPDIAAQMAQALANLDAVLAGAGVRRDEVVRTTMYLHNAGDMAAANAAYGAYFTSPRKPARTTVPGVDWGRPDILVEIDAIAVSGQKGEKR